MPSLRQTSATATPVSACRNANTICASVNLDFFMAIVRLHPVINCPLFSILFWQRFSGGGHFKARERSFASLVRHNGFLLKSLCPTLGLLGDKTGFLSSIFFSTL